VDRDLPATPAVGQRVDQSFAGMVHGTGLSLSAGQALGLFAMVALGHDDAVFLLVERAVGGRCRFGSRIGDSLRRPRDLAEPAPRQIQDQMPDALSFHVRVHCVPASASSRPVARAGEQMEEPHRPASSVRGAGQIQLGLQSPATALENAAAPHRFARLQRLRLDGGAVLPERRQPCLDARSPGRHRT